MSVCEAGPSGPGYDPVIDFCEHGNESLVSLKRGEYLDQLSDCKVFHENVFPRGQLNVVGVVLLFGVVIAVLWLLMIMVMKTGRKLSTDVLECTEQQGFKPLLVAASAAFHKMYMCSYYDS